MLIDAFTFFQELDILEIRLRELYDVVDQFILVEATRTHKGDPKPLYYAENRPRFRRWNDKIRHHVVADLPDGTTQAAIWRREIGQRQEIARALYDTPDDAIVLVSDLDEIPRAEAVAHLAQVGLPDDMVVTFDQTLYYYNVNTACTNLRWNGTRATLAANVRALTPDGIRWSGLRSHEYPRAARFPNAGWHLSYFGDVAHIRQKMTSFLHQELVNDAVLDPDTIARRMAEGIDIWGREDAQQFAIGPATDLPRAIRSDPARWAQYFHPDYRPTFHEDWYDPDQALFVGHLAKHAPEEGAVVEIGCWEGRSAVCIAQAIAPRFLHCVDHWLGNGDEDPLHPAAEAAAGRNVYLTFVRNMELLTLGNYATDMADWRDWIVEWTHHWELEPIAFLHLDAAHDEASVRDCLNAVKPHLLPGAIVCGDDYYHAGVHDGVHAALGDTIHDMNGRLWVYQHEG